MSYFVFCCQFLEDKINNYFGFEKIKSGLVVGLNQLEQNKLGLLILDSKIFEMGENIIISPSQLKIFCLERIMYYIQKCRVGFKNVENITIGRS